MFGRLGIWEIALILVIVLVVFGVGKLPSVGNAIGKGVRAFRRGQDGEDDNQEGPGKPTIQPATQHKSARKV